MIMEFHFYGLHWKTFIILQVWHYLGYSWLAYQAKWSLSLPMTPSHLFILYVFSKHSILSHVISNRDLEFVSKFFYSLDTALDIQLHFTSDYHPEGDRQTKHVNQTLKQYFCIYCNYQQDNWSKLLLLVEFLYNNAPCISLFFTNKGYYLNITIYPEYNIASS